MTKPKKPSVIEGEWPPPAPKEFGAAGRDLFADLTGRFRFSDVEMRTVNDACRTADVIAALQANIDENGVALVQPSGRIAANPACAEVRQQRLALARLIASLRLPTTDNRTQSRPIRGVYSTGA